MASRPSTLSARGLLRVVGGLVVLGGLYLARSQGWLPADSDAEAGGGTATLPEPPPSAEKPAAGSGAPASKAPTPKPESSDDDGGAAQVAALFRGGRSGVMIECDATVKKVLRDDTKGSQHQRFLIRLSDGQTLLVAHNIDLAPRVPLDEGDRVTVKGQYEWNDEGGVLHWTHHDPDGDHEEGWIRHEGEKYE
ncbi:MAG: DUF3465 domain-containing protein [Planctomycetota bacterium]